MLRFFIVNAIIIWRKLTIKKLIIISILGIIVSVLIGFSAFFYKSSFYLNLFGLSLIITITFIFLLREKINEILQSKLEESKIVELLETETEVLFKPSIFSHDEEQEYGESYSQNIAEDLVPFYMLYRLYRKDKFKLYAVIDDDFIKLTFKMENQKDMNFYYENWNLFFEFFKIKN